MSNIYLKAFLCELLLQKVFKKRNKTLIITPEWAIKVTVIPTTRAFKSATKITTIVDDPYEP